jgi:hypothetical protein
LLSSAQSPEEHFVIVKDGIEKQSPSCLVIDPISSLLKADYPFAGLICLAPGIPTGGNCE